MPCPQKGHCCQWLTAALLPHVAAQHSDLLPLTVSRKTGWDIRSSRLYCQTHLPAYKPLDLQKAGERNTGQGDCELQEAVMSPTGTPGSGSMSDGPKNLLNWLFLKTSSLQKFQH